MTRLLSNPSLRHMDKSVFILGRTEDKFALDTLHIINIEKLLWIKLKQDGYDSIIYVDPRIGIFTYDEPSYAALSIGSPDKPKEPSLDMTGFGYYELESDEYDPEDELRPTNDYPQADPDSGKYIAQILDFAIIEHLDLFLKHQRNSAVVFTSFTTQYRKQYDEANSFKDSLEDVLFRDSRDVPDENKLIYIMTGAGSEEALFHEFQSANNEYFTSLFENNRLKSDNKIILQHPELGEVKNSILNYYYLQGKEIPWKYLENISKALYSLKIDLEDIHQNLSMLPEFSLENIRSKFRVKVDSEILTPTEQLSQLIGLSKVKEKLFAVLEDLQEAKSSPNDRGHHMVFQGNPGTGKTQVARLFGEIVAERGLLGTGKYTEIENPRDVLVSPYRDGSTQKATEALEEGRGGVIFIDEAYSLVNESEHGQRDDAGREALQVLLTFMENNRSDTIVIIAGYRHQMDILLDDVNVGMRGRFQNYLDFENYRENELIEIFNQMSAKKDVTFSPKALSSIRKILSHKAKHEPKATFSNARLVRTLFDNTIAQFKARTRLSAHDENLKVIQASDIPHNHDFIIRPDQAIQTATSYLNEFNNIVGLQPVKEFISSQIEKRKKAPHFERLGIEQDYSLPNLTFIGNPGTGKTMVANKLADMLFHIGACEKNVFIPTSGGELRGDVLGASGRKTQEVIRRAMGGVLFIDEFYHLYQTEDDPYGTEIESILMTAADNNAGNLIIIIAGYKNDIEKAFKKNPGWDSRFPDMGRVEFPDYSNDELFEIAKYSFGNEYELLESTNGAFSYWIEDLRERKQNAGIPWGNGRIVNRNIVPSLIRGFEKLVHQKQNRQISVDCYPERYQKYTNDDIDKAGPHEKLAQLKGIDDIKKELFSMLKSSKRLKKNKADDFKYRRHMAFLGNPGTGKTTVAKVVGRLFNEQGVLSTGHLVESSIEKIVSGNGTVAEHLNDLFEEARGGVLFIDEAHNLLHNPHYPQIKPVLINRMEALHSELIVIMAGYSNPMRELYKSDQGLRDRFGKELTFHDFKPDVLYEIFVEEMKVSGLNLPSGILDDVRQIIQNVYNSRDQLFSNARFMEKLASRVFETYSNRVGDAGTGPVILSDFPAEYLPIKNVQSVLKDILDEFSDLVGLATVKDEIRNIVDSLQAHELRLSAGKATGKKTFAPRYVFSGNPGTGKTTVARKMGKIFKALGTISSEDVVEVAREHLVAEYVGQTAPMTRRVFENAKNKVLFIDEAYRLNDPHPTTGDSFGKESIDTMVQLLTDPAIMSNLVVIWGGYPEPMQDFIGANAGLFRRVDKTIHFEDFTNEELLQIFKNSLSKDGYTHNQEVLDRAMKYFEQYPRDHRFGNASVAEKLSTIVKTNLDKRIIKDNTIDLMQVIGDDVPLKSYTATLKHTRED